MMQDADAINGIYICDTAMKSYCVVVDVSFIYFGAKIEHYFDYK